MDTPAGLSALATLQRGTQIEEMAKVGTTGRDAPIASRHRVEYTMRASTVFDRPRPHSESLARAWGGHGLVEDEDATQNAFRQEQKNTLPM